ncbi:hypothetical protein OC842_006897 [Tilletia horrida]|uniref:Uncharacterized protein n=1 Tax=Tilletia horrida TaxID=155126 RepID=A0AAN6G4Z0_9BASI|nr:hypothetical protein OC842_006897 [Tilletia horrida]
MSSSPSLDPEIVDAVHLLLRNSHGQRSVGGDRPPFFTAVAAVKIANALADASSTIRAVVSERMAHHFHMFEPSLSPSVSSTARMWIPRDDDAHWEAETYFLETFRAGDITRQDLLDQIDAFDRYSPTDAQSMKVDARIPAISVLPPSALYGPDCFPLWMASTTLICRVGMPNPNLKFLHLRFSADSTLLARVVQIVSASCAVRDVVVEVDHPRAHPQDTDVPILHLSKLALAGQEYAELERFVFRAPGVDVRVGDDAPFARRVTQCTTFVLAVRSMHLTTPRR